MNDNVISIFDTLAEILTHYWSSCDLGSESWFGVLLVCQLCKTTALQMPHGKKPLFINLLDKLLKSVW